MYSHTHAYSEGTEKHYNLLFLSKWNILPSQNIDQLCCLHSKQSMELNLKIYLISHKKKNFSNTMNLICLRFSTFHNSWQTALGKEAFVNSYLVSLTPYLPPSKALSLFRMVFCFMMCFQIEFKICNSVQQNKSVEL